MICINQSSCQLGCSCILLCSFSRKCLLCHKTSCMQGLAMRTGPLTASPPPPFFCTLNCPQSLPVRHRERTEKGNLLLCSKQQLFQNTPSLCHPSFVPLPWMLSLLCSLPQQIYHSTNSILKFPSPRHKLILKGIKIPKKGKCVSSLSVLSALSQVSYFIF